MNLHLRTAFSMGMFSLTTAILGAGNRGFAEIERFQRPDSNAIELWRVTNEPTVRDHANYHNTQCWSSDGRYLCYTHYGSNGREFGARTAAEVRLVDTHTGRDAMLDSGVEPRWANGHNWLFYVRYKAEEGAASGRGPQIMWLDVDSGKRTRIAYGPERLKETDCGDRWLYGMLELKDGAVKGVRIAIRPNSEPEVLPGDWQVGYNSLYVNPVHPVIVSRDHNYRDYYYATEGSRDIPFVARHFFDHDLAGEHRTTPFPIMEGSHFSWNGDGSYFMAGNGPVRGRKWNEPLPSNIHFLANINVGDICPCGRSGRWICGSTGGGRGPLRLADTRSGDGRVVMKTHSFLCFPGSEDNSGPYDIDAKGSPDGTKIAFVSTYDLKDGPAAEITADFAGDCILVQSTEGFPDKGQLVNASGFGGEVVGYERKTPTSFVGIRRGLYGTSSRGGLGKGQTITSFQSLVIPEQRRQGLPLPPKGIRSIVKDMNSPLMWQRSSDLYVAVVRLPDRPLLRLSSGEAALVPGENHWETYGYHLYRNGARITDSPLRPGASLILDEGGAYAAATVEWSGLESRPSSPLELPRRTAITVLAERPRDFSWTHDRYLVDGAEVSRQAAIEAPEAVREIVHRYDGVIHRQWRRRGELVRRHDLNAQGKATRRLDYQNGKLARRQYYDGQGDLVSTELFAPDGYITESIRGKAHWWYRQAAPVRYVRGSDVFRKVGDRWVKEPAKN